MKSQKVQIELQQPVWILEREAELIRKSDVALTVSVDRPTIVHHFTQTSQGLQVENQRDSIARALYFCLFHLMYEHHDGQRGRQIEIRLKSLIYSSKVKLDQYRLAEIPQQFVQIYDNSALKKLFIEFTQTLIYERGQNRVLRSLRRYPIMDFVLCLAIRTLFHLDHMEPWSLNQSMPINRLMQCISIRLGIPIQLLQPNIWTIAGQTLKIIQQHTSILIVSTNKPLVSSILASGLALSTEDSMPFAQSYEADSLSSSLMSNQNYTPQFHDIKGSVVGFQKFHQQSVSMGHIKSVLSYNTQSLQDSPNKFQLHGSLTSFETPFLQIPARNEDTKLKNQVYKKQQNNQTQMKKLSDRFSIQVNDTTSKSPPYVRKDTNESKDFGAKIEEDLCRGMTSPQLLNFMSPAIVRDLNMMKRHSLAALATSKAGQSPQQHIEFHHPMRTKVQSWSANNSPSTDRPSRQPYSEQRRMTFSPGAQNPLFIKKKPYEEKSITKISIPFVSTLPSYRYAEAKSSVQQTFDSPRTEKSIPSPKLSPVVQRYRLPNSTKLNF